MLRKTTLIAIVFAGMLGATEINNTGLGGNYYYNTGSGMDVVGWNDLGEPIYVYRETYNPGTNVIVANANTGGFNDETNAPLPSWYCALVPAACAPPVPVPPQVVLPPVVVPPPELGPYPVVPPPLSAVPEPGTYALFGIGTAMMMAARRWMR